MMFAGFLSLLLLTGGNTYNHTEPPDAEGVYNQSLSDRGSTYNHSEPPDDEGVYNQSFLDRGSTYNNTEPLDSKDDDVQNRRRGREMDSHCNQANIINHFNLTDKVKFYMARPTNKFNDPTNVTLDIYLYSILDVKEKEQELVAYFWIVLGWGNELITWGPEDFCGLWLITVPSELLWKPDITIEEITKKEKLFQTQFISVQSDGWIDQRNGIVLVSTCKMDFYRFPFDTQTCNLTFKSIQHLWEEVKLLSGESDEDIFQFTCRRMKTESEWLLMNVTVETQEVPDFGFDSSVLVYTMTIKRRSVLYVANFVVPILFFLCLDLASFLISESGGEKLSFKVTVLLAVTVMQLILNDILPSSSDRIPLIAVYCIGVFTLMMLSLLETILMMYLMEKDDVSQDKEADKDQSLDDDCRDQQGKVQNCFRDINKSIPCVRVFDESPSETPPELLLEVKEIQSPKKNLTTSRFSDRVLGPLSGLKVLRHRAGSPQGSSSQLTEEIHDLENLKGEMREVLKTMSLLLSNRKEEKEPSYWTRMTKKWNRIYFIFHIITTSVFLGYVFSLWIGEDKLERKG